MSRHFTWGSRKFDGALFDSLRDPHACPHCGGSGVLRESIDEERLDVAVPCFHCRKYCERCRDWVKISGHQCRGAKA